jgi:biotin transport system substrate-specific component
MRRFLTVVGGVVAIALAARVTATVPGSPVPQSAQTLAVLVVGGVLGVRLATATLLAYLLVGALGAPVFADGGSGWFHLTGPTAGYLLGFVLAAAGLGWLADRGRLGGVPSCIGAMLAGHALILGLGWAWLAGSLGAARAFTEGVGPFLVGSAVKSVLAALVVLAVIRVRSAGRSAEATAPPSPP